MANAARIHRLLHLIDLLRAGGGMNASQLAAACRVSRRTIFRDLALLRETGLPLRYDEKHQQHTLLDQRRETYDSTTEKEWEALLLHALAVRADETVVPWAADTQSAATKLVAALPNHCRQRLLRTAEGIVIQLEPAAPVQDKESVYETLLEGFRNRRCVRVRYRCSGERRELQTLLSPYGLAFRGHRWYVAGRSSWHRAIQTVELNRILRAQPTAKRFRIPPRFSLDRHFSRAWHVRCEGRRVYQVLVRFCGEAARDVAEIRWHKSQRMTWNDDGTLDFRVTLRGLDEIARWVLGYGPSAVVLRPEELRQQIAEASRLTYEHHRGP